MQQCHCSFLLAVIKRAREIECIPLVAPFQAKVIRWLIALLDKCDDSNYSHMPVVERVVDCLVHVTAMSVICFICWQCNQVIVEFLLVLTGVVLALMVKSYLSVVKLGHAYPRCFCLILSFLVHPFICLSICLSVDLLSMQMRMLYHVSAAVVFPGCSGFSVW